ncbi:Lrp/AsnC family transcriptional regulator [Saccharopolyspora hirsuta]|uniref:Lrp/AsnC family transcriptional regulator n=2 Tax=Saccharopolyspora hirsuta TaxID=1837 RepID=A0A5M7BTH4_SACHI|nr:Lrp/AsnC family transcriptional regulator [Saccharopolyspora hirsuta]
MTRKTVMLSESDLALVNALQVWPRAPWSAVATSLGVRSADAVARRWERLAERGDAWTTAYFRALSTGGCVALVTARCRPGTKEQVAATLAEDSCCISVEITAGTQDLLLTVAAQDLEALNHYLVQHVEQVHGLTATTTALVTRFYSEGANWRLHALGASAHAALDPGFGQQSASSITFTGLDRKLAGLLSADGRTSYAQLAEEAGTSQATARRRVTAMLRSRVLALRCEVAAPLVGLPVTATLRGRVAALDVDRVGAGLAGLSPVRMCAAVTGEHNLVATVWLPSISAVQQFEQVATRNFPALVVHDTLVNLRTVKRMGRLLDRSGRATGFVPMRVWA